MHLVADVRESDSSKFLDIVTKQPNLDSQYVPDATVARWNLKRKSDVGILSVRLPSFVVFAKLLKPNSRREAKV